MQQHTLTRLIPFDAWNIAHSYRPYYVVDQTRFYPPPSSKATSPAQEVVNP